MSYRANQFNQRLDRIERKIRPVGSFAHRLANLSEIDREIYLSFRKKLNEWSCKFKGENLYIHILEFIDGKKSDMPTLNSRVKNKLYPEINNTTPYQTYEDLKESMK